MTGSVIENVRKSLARTGNIDSVSPPRPPVLPARLPGTVDEEIETFLGEVRKLSGNARRLKRAVLGESLKGLVAAEGIRRATVWNTPLLIELDIPGILSGLGVELVSPNAGKHEMASCELGVTEADYLLPETGTLVLSSSAEKPRSVSLLPRIHLALVTPTALRADLQQVFAEASSRHYLVFITGPSRTADIELTVTLGVHGPKNLFVWMLDEQQ